MRLVIAAVLALIAGPAQAHSWYPPECCSGRDCRPTARCIQDNGRPGLIAYGHCIEPDWSKVRPPASPDGQYHICAMRWFGSDGKEHLNQICIFLPGAGAA